jgi:hypothetical protein
MGIDRALIARHLCDLLPSQVQARVIGDHAFISQYGLLSRTIVTIGAGISIDQLELLAAVRRVLAGNGNQNVNDVSGRQLLVTADHDTVVLKEVGQNELKQFGDLPDLMVLSPNGDDRIRALNRVINNLGPTAPDFSALQMEAEKRELTDVEIAGLLEEISTGFEAHRTRIASAHSRDHIQLDDIVPDSLSYYERFCGPNLRNAMPEEYLTGTLPAYRQQLLRRNLVRGLEICLLGALRDDLMPAAWTGEINDDDIWKALEKIDTRANPFVLLGVLDIAITRQHDERYKTLAAETMSMLVQEQLLRPDGVDCYEIIPLFAQLALDRINVLEGGALCEPFWKRMGAWMHAGLLMQSTLHIQIKLEALREWVDSNRDMAGTYAQMIDLRREPMYRAGEISRSYLREEIIGRLVILRARHQAAGRSVPHSEDIDAAMTRLASKGSPLGWAMPGPLDGHRRPADQKGRALSETDVGHVMEELSKDPYGAIWSKLAYFSQCFDLGEKILERACEASARTALDVELLEGENKLGRLFDICLVAAAHRNKDLARSIAAAALARAPRAVTGNAAMSILHILLLASAAFEHEDEWSSWIGEQLVGLAYNLPAGEATRALREHLNEIKKVMPISIPVCSRAEAAASAAN